MFKLLGIGLLLLHCVCGQSSTSFPESTIDIFDGLDGTDYSTGTMSFASNSITITIIITPYGIIIRITGSSIGWYGVGFGTSIMEGSDAFITTEDGTVEERILGDHASGTSTYDYLRNTTVTIFGDSKTITTYRDSMVTGEGYYTFDCSLTSIPVIWAQGTRSTLSRHGDTSDDRDSSSIPMTIHDTTGACSLSIPTTDYDTTTSSTDVDSGYSTTDRDTGPDSGVIHKFNTGNAIKLLTIIVIGLKLFY